MEWRSSAIDLSAGAHPGPDEIALTDADELRALRNALEN